MKKLPFAELPLRKKVSTKLFILTIAWWISALLAIFFTLSLLSKLEGAGAAINDAGSLRMRAYKLVILDHDHDKGALLEASDEFSKVLEGVVEGNSKRPLLLPQEENIIEQAESLLLIWNQDVLPSLLSGSEQSITFDEASLFVSKIDTLVQMIEKSNADTLNRLKFYQYFLIALVVAGSVMMLYILLRLIVRPLQRLNYAFSHVQREDFTYHETLNRSDDEFGLLSIGYNKMAKRLEDVYRGLEDNIKEKTQSLQMRNMELESLYRITSFLHDQHDIKTICQGFLAKVMPILKADAAAIRLHDYNEQQMQLVAEINLSNELRHSLKCGHFEACYCGKFGLTESVSEERRIQALLQHEPPCSAGNYKALTIFPIVYDREKIGIMTFFSYDAKELEDAQKHLVDALSNQLGVAIGGVRLLERVKRIAVLEERNQLAQGLHDSIAQTLNYMNLQVQMLEKALDSNNKVGVAENLDFIKEGLKESYDNVRQLLLNFRTPLRLESFSSHLEELVRQFKQQTNIELTAMVDASNIDLSDKEKLEVVLIVQEALSNIRKHANATKVSLQIYSESQNIIVKVIDNGQGFDKKQLSEKSLRHVGLMIMDERAQKINAELHLESKCREGTKLRLSIPRKCQ